MRNCLFRMLSIFLLVSLLLGGCAKTGDTASIEQEAWEMEFNGGILRVAYPRLTGGSDAVNDALRNAAENLVWEVYDRDDTRQIDADLDYEISYQSDTVLSVVFTGLGTVQGAAHPNQLLFARTVNLQDGTLLSLPDLTSVDETLAQRVAEAVATAPLHEDDALSDAMAEYLQKYSAADWLELLQTDRTVQSYRDGDGIVIAVEVPSAIGSWAKIRLSD